KNNPNNIINRSLFGLSLSAGILAAGIGGLTTVNTLDPILWCTRACFAGAFVFMFSISIFIASFPAGSLNLSKNVIWAIFAPLAAVFLFTGVLIEQTIKLEAMSWEYQFFYSRVSLWFGFFTIIVTGLSLWRLIEKKRLYKSGLLKTQLNYALLGLILILLAHSLANIISPLFGITRYIFMGPAVVILSLFSITYAVIRHHLPGIWTAMKKGLVYTVLITILTGTISFITKFVFIDEKSISLLIIFQVVTIAVAYRPLESFMFRLADTYFFRGQYDYQKTLRSITRRMTSILKLSKLLEMISGTIVEEMQVSNVSIFLKKKGYYCLQIEKRIEGITKTKIDKLSDHHPLIQYLHATHKHISKDFLQVQRERYNAPAGQYDQESGLLELLQEMRSALVFPFIVRNELIGFMSISERCNGDSFSETDIRLLETLANQSVISIENARLYERSIKKVLELVALYEVGQVITAGHHVNAALQSILAAVVNVVGVDRGVIFLYDHKKEKLIAKALHSRIKPEGPVNIKEWILPVNVEELAIELKEGRPWIKTSVTKDDIEKTHCLLKMLEVESFAAVPLKSKDHTIGIIAVDNKISKAPIDRINIGLLTTLANQAAVIVENARLYHEKEQKIDELTNVNKKLEDILAHMSSGVMVIDDQGKLQTFNHQAEIITSLQKQQVLGKSINDLWGGVDKGFYDSLLTLDMTEPALREVTLNLEDGEKTIAMTTTPLLDSNSKLKGRLVVLNDLTELKKMELHIRRSDRLSALGKMAAGVAHEIKNPLTSMRLLTQMMKRYGEANFQLWESNCDILIDELDRIDKIVNDFVGFAKTPKLKIEKVNIYSILEKVFRLIKIQAQESGVNMKLNVDKQLEVQGDAQRLTQVFMNLIINAIQAMPPDKKDGLVVISSKAVWDSKAQIVVSDNGSGIFPESMENLFTPFFTTKEKGTGLGLSIIHKIMEEHDGAIDVESIPGEGTEFTVSIPISNDIKTISAFKIRQKQKASNITMLS
ncbi:MAG: ATP-binding protein, partial [Candidatus Margulisiibacteriota bacterium]